jgi:hypothetical protein
MSYEPRHFARDDSGEHARSRAAWRRLADIDRQLVDKDHPPDHWGRMDLVHAQTEIVRVHGRPPRE